jgi:hypothetical protein
MVHVREINSLIIPCSVRFPELCPALLRWTANVDVGMILALLVLHA